MPVELVVESPKKIAYFEYEDRELVDNEVLVRTTVSGIKHGTEINSYRGVVPFADRLWDPNLRLFRPLREGEVISPYFPHRMGSWAAGVVVRVGPKVSRVKPGDRVHGEWKHRQTAIMPEGALYTIPDGVDDETMVFSDPARFALGGIHDAAIKLGDRVAIFGLGAIGMLALQMARLNGAAEIYAIDPVPERLDLARELGADLAIDPNNRDAGIVIKQATSGGVDVALEVSGVYTGLQQAVRSVHREGLVVTVSFYGDRTGHLDLSSEWHHNRITLRSSMPVWGCTHRCQPMWDLVRLEQTAVNLLTESKLLVRPLIGDRVPFERAAEAYSMIDQGMSRGVKIVLTYS